MKDWQINILVVLIILIFSCIFAAWIIPLTQHHDQTACWKYGQVTQHETKYVDYICYVKKGGEWGYK